jgi:acetylornithine deacetylase/succinyl-diaminopimelate desuccinylase-like protein
MRPLRRRILPPLVAAALLAAAPHAERSSARAQVPDLSEAGRWLRGYVRIDTTNPPGGERQAASYLAAILHREGIATRLLVSPAGRTSLYARLEAERPGEGSAPAGPLVLLHHMDVVPPGPGWSVEPFGGQVRSGRLHGRGALDIKSLGVAHLAAFLDLARRATPLARDVIFLAVADEETGGLEGLAWILESHGELFPGLDRPDAAVLGEGGANRTVNGRALWAGIEVAQKRPLWLRVTASGRRGHGSGLNPASASHELVRGLARALDLPPRWQVTEAARRYLGGLAPLHNEKYRRIFTHLDEVIEEDGPTEDLLPGLANLFLDTFQVTVLEAGEKINVTPGRATAEVDVRLLPETDGDAYLARVREALGSRLEAEVLLTSPPVPPSPTDHPVYRAVAGVLDDTAPPVPAFIPGFTDSRWFRERRVAAYGVSPFFLEPQDFLGIHGPDEAIPVTELERGVERMRRIVRACAAR